MTRPQQNHKVVCFQGPATVSSSATSAATVDTLGYDYVVIDAVQNPATAADSSAQWTALQLEHGSTTHASNHTAINGAIGTSGTPTTAQFSLPEHNDTSVGGIVRFFVSMIDKERYLRVQQQASVEMVSEATSVTAISYNIAYLSQGDESPDTAALRGVGANVFV